ncbi:spore germination protein [Neobacillus muris]|uniref:spore germination protein n=1 Tax=Neobacillus muris TaxID=2941334 RepID=UPI00203E7A5D|nr:spore germination protein [Neobacillus muris]
MFKKNRKLTKQAPVKQEAATEKLAYDLQTNTDEIQEQFGKKSDLAIRFFEEMKMAVVYIESLVDNETIQTHVIEELNNQKAKLGATPLKEISLSVKKVIQIETSQQLKEQLLQGYTVILKDGERIAIAAETSGGDKRPVSESTNESVVRGPRDAFNESLMTNIGLIRKRIHTEKLKIYKCKIGTLSKTAVAILYIEGAAKDENFQEVKSRIEKIEIDGILESLYVEEMIEDPNGYTPFPTIFNSERPDRITAGLLEGRIAILVDGTPAALLVPATIGLFLTSNEDYYQRYDFGSFMKMLRAFAYLLSFVLPGFYVSILTYHQEMIPTPLLIALTGQREGVPYGVAVEIVLMELTFEILREASLRLPKTIGAAVSIVGGLVLGQAAVEAGLVGQATVIVVSFTAICAFTTPSYNLAIAARILRFAVIFLCAILGIFGLFFCLIVLFTHLNKLRSFGSPFLSPFVPYHKKSWMDFFFRHPWWSMETRPNEIAGSNQRRMPEESNNPHMRRRK